MALFELRGKLPKRAWYSLLHGEREAHDARGLRLLASYACSVQLARVNSNVGLYRKSLHYNVHFPQKSSNLFESLSSKEIIYSLFFISASQFSPTPDPA